MNASPQTPHWEVRDTDEAREIRLLGDWNVLSLAGSERDYRTRLQALSHGGDDVWDLAHVGALDSAGAHLLWQAWGERYPGNLHCSEGQEARFERLRRLPDIGARPRAGVLQRALISLGKSLGTVGSEVAGMVVLAAKLLVDLLYCFGHPRAIPWRGMRDTLYQSGVQSLLLMAFIGVLVGDVLVSQIAGNLQNLGIGSRIIGMAGLAILREVGPFLAAIVLVGRSGSTFTAGIGAMRVTDEIAALRVLGASPTLRLVFPRVLGLTVATPLLVIWINFAAVFGAMYEANKSLGLPWGMWLARFGAAVPISNYVIGLAKGALFGAIIGLVSSYYGLKVEPNTQSLSAYTTRSVVVGLSLVIVINSLLSQIIGQSSFIG